jgi:hypothetical protein
MSRVNPLRGGANNQRLVRFVLHGSLPARCRIQPGIRLVPEYKALKRDAPMTVKRTYYRLAPPTWKRFQTGSRTRPIAVRVRQMRLW